MKTILPLVAALALAPFAAAQQTAEAPRPAAATPAKNAATAPARQAGAPQRPAQQQNAANAPLLPPWAEIAIAESKDPALIAERKALENLRREKLVVESELALIDSKRRAALAPLNEERAALESDRALRAAKSAAANADAEREKTTLERKLARLNAESSARLLAVNTRLRELENEARILRAAAEAATAAPQSELALRNARANAERIVNADTAYPDEPLIDGVLHISDRRIPFNGPVTNTLADFVVNRIAFYNNKNDKAPIFIVMDSSPGGSVFAGHRILRAMESSKAPVIVVVKQFAASMAAITTTLAKRSYCYPETRILHHQMSTGLFGNMTRLRESLGFTEDLYVRTFGPVYTKLGYKDAAAFEKDMYAHTVTGDWMVAGDEAAKRKWVGATVDRMVETGVTEIGPDEAAPSSGPAFAAGCKPVRGADGRLRFELPPLTTPGDAWVIHDPEKRFIAAP